jgi:tetratricopeptide (TPR) repeat protein
MNAYVKFLDGMRRLDEGWKECQIAQQVDASNDHLSSALERRGQHDLAIAKLLMMLKGQPNDAGLHWLLYHSYKSNGMYKQAVQELENTLTLLGFKEFATRVHRAFAISGYRGAMREWAKELEQAAATKQAFYPLQAAEAYVTIGDKDRAFYRLEKAYQHPDIVEATSNAGLELINTKWLLLDPLRSDPRFKDLVRRVGLPQ